MEKFLLRFEAKGYDSLECMTSELIDEANEQIIRIDLGELKNIRENRNYAKFRLMHIQRSYSIIPERFRSIYNSLWSQLYRLEHQGQYTNPYLKQMMDRLRNGF